MDKIIKQGTLRLQTSESTCDVILSCKGHRLLAHKLILSIASPVLRELLRKDFTDSTSVIILPDINSSTMSTILDYIYTGTAVVYSNCVQEFLSVTTFLKIQVDTTNLQKYRQSAVDRKEFDKKDIKKNDEAINKSNKDVLNDLVYNAVNKSEDSIKSVSCERKFLGKKTRKRMPDLLPISGGGALRKNAQKKLCNIVVPSPWCLRDDRSFFGDPRMVCFGASEVETSAKFLEDTNNNFQTSPNIEASSRYIPKKLNSIIKHLYQNTSESNIEKWEPEATLLPQHKTSSNIEETIRKKFNHKSELGEKCDGIISETVKDMTVSNLSGLRNNVDLAKSFENKFKKTLTFECDVSEDLSKMHGFDCKKPCTNSKKPNLPDHITENSTNTNKTFTFLKNLHLTPTARPKTDYPSTSLPPSTNLLSSSPIVSPRSPTQSVNPVLPPKFGDKKGNFEVNDSNLSSESFTNDNKSSNESGDEETREDERKKEKKKAFVCEDCGKSFSQLRNYKYHRSVHEGTKVFSAKCFECGKTFNDKGYLSSHMKIHRDRKEYACPSCPKRFNQRVAYNMHMRIHTGLKPHECPTCGKSFSRKMLLKQHQRVHTGERPYSCPECGKTFADRSNMSLHARLHTGVKPYACSICPKSFTKKHHLKTHMNFHTGLKPYKCENCGLAFSQSSNMRTHYKKCVLRETVITKSGLKADESVSSLDNSN